MDFGANKTPTEVIKESAFGGMYFRDIYSGVTGKCGTKNHGKNLISWKILIRSFIVQVIMVLVLNKYVLNAEHRQDLGKIKFGSIK